MKSLYIAIGLFTAVIIYITVNYSAVNSLLDYTEERLNRIPNSEQELESMNKTQKEEISKTLKEIDEKWQKSTTFLCMSLVHDVGRGFTEEIIPASAYFDAEDYPEFLARIKAAKDNLDHIRYDEGIKLGNIM